MPMLDHAKEGRTKYCALGMHSVGTGIRLISFRAQVLLQLEFCAFRTFGFRLFILASTLELTVYYSFQAVQEFTCHNRFLHVVVHTQVKGLCYQLFVSG